jgi:hypothetical protein
MTFMNDQTNLPHIYILCVNIYILMSFYALKLVVIIVMVTYTYLDKESMDG